MKKFILILIILLLTGLVAFRQSTLFVWVNPYTYTGSYSNISKTIKGIEDGLKFARKASIKDGKNFNYLYENAYGSGFLNSNPIPNDLDFSVGIDLGTYEFDGKNSENIACEIVDRMEAFQFFFNTYFNTDSNKNFYIDKTYFEIINTLSAQRQKNIKAIVESLPAALSGKEYIKYTEKVIEDGSDLDLPYIMKPNEILIEDYDPIMLYSDIVEYNSEMPHYIRSISIIPEFFVNVKYNEKVIPLEIVPESYRGERMQLVRRFFASSTFVGANSRNYLKNSLINNDEKYFYYRMISFKRHLQEISNIQVMKDRPIKMLKRFMQTADIMRPVINDKDYTELQNIVAKNLQNRDIQLLNEYINICTTVYLIQEHPNLYLKLKNDGKIKIMYETLLSVTNELENRDNIANLNILKDFAEKDLKKLELIENKFEVEIFKSEIFDRKYKLVNDAANIAVYSLIEDKDKLDKFALKFEKIYTDTGFHKVKIYWLDKNTIGILSDDFTRNIKDLKKFAKDNELADVNYKLINNTQIPRLAVKYRVWAQYNPTLAEQEKFKRFKALMLEDKKNFNIKNKLVF